MLRRRIESHYLIYNKIGYNCWFANRTNVYEKHMASNSQYRFKTLILTKYRVIINRVFLNILENFPI